jgi:hypothetical protein
MFNRKLKIMIQHIIDIVKGMSISCWRPDTVVQIYNAQDIAHPTFGADFTSYKEQYFWSRSWEQNGATPSKMAAKFPAVLLVSDYAELKEKDLACQTWTLLVADIPDCPTCPEVCRRSKVAIQQDLFATLTYIKSKLTERSLVTLVDDSQAWVSIRVQKELKFDRLVKCVEKTIYPEWDIIKDLPLNRDNSIWKGVQFTVCDCVDTSFEEVEYNLTSRKGEPKCGTC